MLCKPISIDKQRTKGLKRVKFFTFIDAINQQVFSMGEEKEQITNQVVKQEIIDIRERLDLLNSEKEKWFEKKEALKLKIADLIKQVREVKSKNDSLSNDIKVLKEKRDKQNEEVRKLITEIKEINKKSGVSSGFKVNPQFIHNKMEALQTRIETGALSFENEKKLMKEIKQLKKEYAAAKISAEINKGANEISKKIDDAKEIAENYHNQISEKAKENKDVYKEFLRLSKEINKVKKEQEDAFDKFIKFKQEFSEVNKGFKEEVKKNNDARKDNKKKKEKIAKDRKEQDLKKIEENKEKVEEKIKSKGKKILTTEDLIAFQGND